MTKPAEPYIVYIVDDDDLVRKGLARLMRASGFIPKIYESPERFLEELVPTERACILLDITMPRMTGLQVQLRLRERGVGIPVIAVSARDDEETRHCAGELAARCFLRKPVDDQALLDAITWVMQTEQTAQPMATVPRHDLECLPPAAWTTEPPNT